ncbi:hypothetical protein AB1Y20_004744 [Prymnesium parvum]|uniref:Uncharacterized protein n=1 Tax=Prymnesium parvum TaxID=97485 RepID=A0AB34IZ67_PRYPA
MPNATSRKMAQSCAAVSGSHADLVSRNISPSPRRCAAAQLTPRTNEEIISTASASPASAAQSSSPMRSQPIWRAKVSIGSASSPAISASRPDAAIRSCGSDERGRALRVAEDLGGAGLVQLQPLVRVLRLVVRYRAAEAVERTHALREAPRHGSVVIRTYFEVAL